MPEFGLNLELDVDGSAGLDLTTIALEWFDEVSRTALGEPRTALEKRGPVPAAPQFVDPAAWNPASAPVTLKGSLTVSSRRPKAFDAKAMTWLRDQLTAEPELVDLQFALFAGSGPEALSVWYPSLYAHRPEESPGWLRIGAYVAEKTFLDPRHGAEAQQLWLGVLRSFAERVDPGFGQIEYGFDTSGTTALEGSLSPDIELEERVADYTVAKCRRYLRGYSWLTVVPAELADRLGGPAALETTKAFVEVSPLRSGGVWLLATDDYREYGPEQVEAVFQALAPMLRPGLPRPNVPRIGKPPRRVVAEDAAGRAAG
jgi:hypothetical protein